LLLLDRGADRALRGTHGQHTALQLAAVDSPAFVPLLIEPVQAAGRVATRA
jgi:hypothetical protein